jgi:hypothetical protein
MLITALAVFARAEPTDPSSDEAPLEGRTYKYLERQELILEGVEVKGELIAPAVRLTTDKPRPKFNPLIALRTDWDAEMRASIDDIE